MSKFSGNEARRRQKALTPLREASGKLQREPQEERTAEIVAIVLAQPHRRGDAFVEGGTSWSTTPIGRMIRDKLITRGEMTAEELARAAEQYVEARGREKTAIASQRIWACNPDARTPTDLSPEKAAEWRREWGDVRHALRDAGPMAVDAIHAVLREDLHPDTEVRCFPFWVKYGAGVGLLALARYFKIV
jgi:hypothetical protein